MMAFSEKMEKLESEIAPDGLMPISDFVAIFRETMKKHGVKSRRADVMNFFVHEAEELSSPRYESLTRGVDYGKYKRYKDSNGEIHKTTFRQWFCGPKMQEFICKTYLESRRMRSPSKSPPKKVVEAIMDAMDFDND